MKHKINTLSLYQLLERFPDNDSARLHIEQVRWNGSPVCPHCGNCDNNRIAVVKNSIPMPYRCKDCRKFFSVKTGTVFAESKLSYRKCLMAIYLLTTAKKGIPSTLLAKELGITQKSAWHLAHRIRSTMTQSAEPLTGDVEVDETYIGGKEKNKHRNKKQNLGRGSIGKVAVVGMKERGGQVRAEPVEATTSAVLLSQINSKVSMKANVYTDEARAYLKVGVTHSHETIAHSVGEYVRGKAHTNGIESFWALLKRGYYGTHHHFTRKHLSKYVDEFSTRHNLRTTGTIGIIDHCIREMGGSLSWEELTNG